MQAPVLEDFKLVTDGFGHLPGFCAIQQSDLQEKGASPKRKYQGTITEPEPVKKRSLVVVKSQQISTSLVIAKSC